MSSPPIVAIRSELQEKGTLARRAGPSPVLCLGQAGRLKYANMTLALRKMGQADGAGEYIQTRRSQKVIGEKLC